MTSAKNKTIKRLWINSLEVDEIRKGFNNLLDNEEDLLMYKEAYTRQISDWRVGINGSQLFSLLLAKKRVRETLSIGRVQSSLVYLVYQRQKEIEHFVSKPFFELVGKFAAAGGQYEGKAKIKTDTLDELHAFLLANEAILESEM